MQKKISRKKWPREILGARRMLLAPRSSRGNFFLAAFFCVTHNGLSERGTTCSLLLSCWCIKMISLYILMSLAFVNRVLVLCWEIIFWSPGNAMHCYWSFFFWDTYSIASHTKHWQNNFVSSMQFIAVPLLTYLLAKKELTLEEVFMTAGTVISAGVDTVSMSTFFYKKKFNEEVIVP